MERICSSCGNKHHKSYTGKRCVKCKEFLSFFVCNVCGRCLPKEEFASNKPHCKACKALLTKLYYAENPDKYANKLSNDTEFADKQYDGVYAEWRKAIAELEPISSLTESEWFEIVSFFNGCALCADSHVEKRMYFDLPSNGGKYNRFNIFPVCNECGSINRNMANPFKYFNRAFKHINFLAVNSKEARKNITNERITRLVDYIYEKAKEAAANASKDKGI